MAATKKETSETPDAQSTMTDFVQSFARPQTPAPTPAERGALNNEATSEAAAATEPVAAAAEEFTETVEPSHSTAPAEEEAKRPSTSGKKKPVAPTGEDAGWADTYLQPVRARKTKAIYVDEDTHAALALITQEVGAGIADLLINIVNNHFEAFRPEIREFLAERERLKKKKFQF
ncbi:MAG: DUF3408 domain-containing protein [Janthinobacterium lividum]